MKHSLTSNENIKPRNSTVSQSRASHARTSSSKATNLQGSPSKSAQTKQDTSKPSQYNFKNLNRSEGDFVGSPTTHKTSNKTNTNKVTANNQLKSDSAKILPNRNNNLNDSTNKTAAVTNTQNTTTTHNAPTFSATTLNPYSYPSGTMMYPNMTGISSTTPYYYMNQQQPTVYSYPQQQPSTLYSFHQPYSFTQQYNSQPDLNKRYHF
jgi:hypothetical protein